MAKKRSAEEAGIGNKAERAKSENLPKIRKQIDYYFGNFNLPKDRFMNRVIKDEGGEWFPAEVLLRFKKIKSLGATLADIVDACAESEVVKMNVEGTHIKRMYALKGPRWISDRTIQAKGFPKEKIDIHELIEFWSKTCPDVKNVKFCGMKTGVIALSFADKKLADEWAQNKHEVIYKGEKITMGRNLWIRPIRKYEKPRKASLRPDAGGEKNQGKGQGANTNGGAGDDGGPGSKDGYHSTLGKRQKLSDGVAKDDKNGKGGEQVAAGQEKPQEADKADMEMKNEGEGQAADQEKPAEADKADHEVKNAGMDVDVKTPTDKPADMEDIQKGNKSENEKVPVELKNEGDLPDEVTRNK